MESELSSTTPLEPLQPQVRRRHPFHQRLAEAHDHHARRPHDSHDGARPGTSHTKPQSTSNTTSKRGRGNTVAVQGMNIEILPLQGKIKYFGQLVNFKNAEEVEFEHRIKCAWATFTSHRQELTSPTYPLRDRLELFDATVTP